MKNAKIEISAFDASSYLQSEASIAAYINAVLEENDPALLLAAIATVAKARGMAKVAEDAGLGRESLYKALAPNAKPRYDTVFRLLHALGVKLHVSAI